MGKALQLCKRSISVSSMRVLHLVKHGELSKLLKGTLPNCQRPLLSNIKDSSTKSAVFLPLTVMQSIYPKLMFLTHENADS